jgi:hypothetical protein
VLTDFKTIDSLANFYHAICLIVLGVLEDR